MLDDYRHRLQWAWRLLQQREIPRRVTQTEVVSRVSRRLGGRAFSYPTGSRWFTAGDVPRELDVQIALAEELGVDPGWLYYGPYSAAPAPAGYVAPGDQVTARERAIREAEAAGAKRLARTARQVWPPEKATGEEAAELKPRRPKRAS